MRPRNSTVLALAAVLALFPGAGTANAGAKLRAEVQKKLQEAGIQSMIYYPVPLYRQQTHADLHLNPADYPTCEQISDQVLSLPMFPELTAGEQQQVADALIQVLTAIPAHV